MMPDNKFFWGAIVGFLIAVILHSFDMLLTFQEAFL